jgi:predicted AlkP superfamily phosphohydrolase/phosphomutase
VKRLVVLALSEASPVLIEQFCSRGTMPHLQALRAAGLTGRTRYSTPYLLTPQMWATILTGRTPGSHGVFDYWQRGAGGSFFETRGRDIRGPRLWDELESNGVPCGIINVPMTYPPPKVKGFALSGQDAPGAHPSICWPRSFYHDVTRRFGRYHHKDIFPGGQTKSDYAGVLQQEVLRQAELFEWIVRREDWRFLMLYTSGTAFAQHYFWEDMVSGAGPAAGVVEATYAAIDGMVGKLAAALDPTDRFFLMSECGAGPIACGVRLNSWLRREGFLAHSSLAGEATARARVLSLIRMIAQRYVPKTLYHAVNSLPVKSWIQEKVALDGIDWSRTVAYHRGKGEGNIYLNVKGRDPKGIVDPARYDHVRQDIIMRLLELRDPETGARAVAAVHCREDLFAGEHVTSAPDLVVEWNGFRYMPSEEVAAGEAIFTKRTREYMTWPTSGSHRPEGLLVAHGGGIGLGVLPRPVELIDLAPTWLTMLDCPVPPNFQGKPDAEFLRATAPMGADRPAGNRPTLAQLETASRMVDDRVPDQCG